jgi:hypothetical protein
LKKDCPRQQRITRRRWRGISSERPGNFGRCRGLTIQIRMRDSPDGRVNSHTITNHLGVPVGTKKSGKGRRKLGRKKRRMRAKIRHRKK